jgi:hypothetical protein
MAAIGLLEIRDDPEKRRLPAAGRPDEGNELAFGNLQVYVGQGVDRTVGGLVGEGQPPNVDHRSMSRISGRPRPRGRQAGSFAASRKIVRDAL